MISQRGWRIVGGIALAISGVMAALGVRLEFLRTSKIWFLCYWITFLVSLLVAVYCAFLDLKYIRLQQAVAERELFLDTLGEESLRKALRTSSAKRQNSELPPPSSSS